MGASPHRSGRSSDAVTKTGLSTSCRRALCIRVERHLDCDQCARCRTQAAARRARHAREHRCLPLLPWQRLASRGGREYEAIAGDDPSYAATNTRITQRCSEEAGARLPSLAGTGGPFVGQRGKLVNAERLDVGERGNSRNNVLRASDRFAARSSRPRQVP